RPKYRMPNTVKSICILADLNQAWRMFAPPPPTGGWFVIPGTLTDGTQIDLFKNGAPLNWTKPSKQEMFKNERWRRYMFSYVFGKNRVYWDDYGSYLCKSWNSDPLRDPKLKSLQIIFMARRTPPPGMSADYEEKL